MVNDARRLVVIGAGGHAKVVLATAIAAGWNPVALLDDDSSLQGQRVSGVPVLGTPDQVASIDADGAILAVGSNHSRQELAHRLTASWVSIVHPSAVIDPSVDVGIGTVVFAGAVIQPDTKIGRHVIINTCVSIDHDGAIADFAHIAPGCRLAGNVTVDSGALLGIGSSVVPGTAIGEWSVVGAGAAVLSDIPPKSTAVGVPGRVIEQNQA
jgi:UDP-perosamine 4-acetyltransferase